MESGLDMLDARDVNLETMSVQELLDLQAQIHLAIRAQIREKNARLAGAPLMSVPTATAVLPRIDLERERDQWLASRRKG